MKINTLIILAATFLVALPAAAAHPGNNDMAEVKRLSHEVTRAARHLHRNTEAEAHQFSRRENYALGHLHDLQEASRHFHGQVEKFFKSPRHTERDFGRLYTTYREALDTFHYLHSYGHLNRDLESVRRPMERLAAYYGYEYGYSYHGGHGSYDRYDRYDRRYDHRYGHRPSVRWNISIGWRK